MKRISLGILLLALFLQVHAQFKQVAEGPVFEEPEDGFAKILQLKNGNAMFFHFTFSDGVKIRLYSAAHKEIAVTSTQPGYGKMKRGAVKALFENNGDAVVFVSEIESKSPVLYRLIFDGNTGVLREEKKIIELSRLKGSEVKNYATLYSSNLADFYVKKDAYTDNYAIGILNGFAPDKTKRIEVIFYSGNHTESGHAYYTPPDDKYQYFQYLDMVVTAPDRVCMFAHVFNIVDKERDGILIMASLVKGSSLPTATRLEFTRYRTVSYGIARYNPVSKHVILIVTTELTATQLEYHMAQIDPVNQQVIRADKLRPFSKREETNGDYVSMRTNFRGDPQNIYVHADGSYAIPYELVYASIRATSDMPGYREFTSSHAETSLGSLAILDYDKDGNELNGYWVPKNQLLAKTYLFPFYLASREGSGQHLNFGSQFKSYEYVTLAGKNYVLMNDLAQNEESAKKGKIQTVFGVGSCDGFAFPLETKVAPVRQYVFGKPATDRSHNLGLFSISDKDEKNNLYITLKLEKDGAKKGVKLVWLSPE